MKLLVAIDEHYVFSGGHIYSTEGTTPYEFFQREYLRVFDRVQVLARVRSDQRFSCPSAAISDGPNVEFCRVQEFRGPLQYLSLRHRIVAQVRSAVAQADVCLLRGPGTIGRLVARELNRVGRSYAVEVLGDPEGVFGPGRVGGPFRAIFRKVLTHELKEICWKAMAISYVTKSFLQRRYPAAPNAFVAACSDAHIGQAIVTEEQLERKIRAIANLPTCPTTLGFVGSLQQPYKGADVLLRAIAICRSHGFDLRAQFAGEGRLRTGYERLAQELGLSEHVQFVGRLGSGKPIFQFLDSITLFVMPSFTEGLPRAMIEAMARGCPCIGSDVGGIPELLASDDVVPPGDVLSLAKKIMEKVGSSSELARMARRNHANAKNYRPERLQASRFMFLDAVRHWAITETIKTPTETEPCMRAA